MDVDKSKLLIYVFQIVQLDANLQPDFNGIITRIQRLPLPAELKSDMTDAVEFCQRFSVSFCTLSPHTNAVLN